MRSANVSGDRRTILVDTRHNDAEAMVAALAPQLAPVKLAAGAASAADTKRRVVGLVTDSDSPRHLRAACRAHPDVEFLVFLAHGGSDLLAAGLPTSLPVLRLRDPCIAQSMIDYVSLHLLAFHRNWPQYEQQRRRRMWRPIEQLPASQRRVTVLGLGEVGAAVARHVAALGFDTRGWSRTPKKIAGVHCHHGPLRAVLRGSDVLVNVLPATAQTRGLLGAAEFAALRRGACVINVGRGVTVQQPALLRALRSGQLGHAVLDVTDPEPLPPTDPLWDHPRVTLTPHIGGSSSSGLSMFALATLLRAALARRAGRWRVDPVRGY